MQCMELRLTKKHIDVIQMKLLWAGVFLLLFMFLFQSARREHYGPGRYGEWMGWFVDKTIGGGTMLGGMLNAILFIFDPCNYIPRFHWIRLFRNLLCSREAGCKEGEEKSWGLCYTPCKPGYKSNAFTPYMCMKEYPEFENNGMLHTFFNITKSSKTVVGSPLNYCDKKSMDAGLCYDECKKGTKGVGPMCWQDWYGVGIGTIP